MMFPVSGNVRETLAMQVSQHFQYRAEHVFGPEGLSGRWGESAGRERGVSVIFSRRSMIHPRLRPAD